jgi:hypothetical protein
MLISARKTKNIRIYESWAGGHIEIIPCIFPS